LLAMLHGWFQRQTRRTTEGLIEGAGIAGASADGSACLRFNGQ
jgi:hypothetical protein